MELPLSPMRRRWAWALVVAAAVALGGRGAGALAAGNVVNEGDRVDFSKHGGDWMKGSCASRKRQSPVDLFEVFRPAKGSFSYFYADVHTQPFFFENDGRVLKVDATGQGFGGVTMPTMGSPWYSLKEIRFRGKSEHTIRGKHAPVELQLVHQGGDINDQTASPDLVIISVLLGEDVTMPEVKPVWPALLQGQAAQLRGGAAQRRQAPQEEDDAEEPDESARDQARREGYAEVSFARSLAGVAAHAEVRQLARQAREEPAEEEAAEANEAVAIYTVPPPTDPGFSPALQHFLKTRPPEVAEEVQLNLTMTEPLQLGAFLAGGTFFAYAGSETLPPCEEKVTWLVRRERVPASAAQVGALLKTILNVTEGAGNYRTVMPLNQRNVEVWDAVEKEPGPKPFTMVPPMGPPMGYDDDRESKFIPMAKDAITISKAAADYARDLDDRLQRASEAHAQVLESWQFTTTTVPTTRPYMPKSPLDVQWGAHEIGRTMEDTFRDAVFKNTNGLVHSIVNNALGQARQDFLASYGFTTPAPTTTPPPAAR